MYYLSYLNISLINPHETQNIFTGANYIDLQHGQLFDYFNHLIRH